MVCEVRAGRGISKTQPERGSLLSKARHVAGTARTTCACPSQAGDAAPSDSEGDLPLPFPSMQREWSCQASRGRLLPFSHTSTQTNLLLQAVHEVHHKDGDVAQAAATRTQVAAGQAGQGRAQRRVYPVDGPYECPPVGASCFLLLRNNEAGLALGMRPGAGRGGGGATPGRYQPYELIDGGTAAAALSCAACTSRAGLRSTRSACMVAPT